MEQGPSLGIRSKFYAPDAELSFPILIERDLDAYLNELADEGDEDVQQLVNEWLRLKVRSVRSVREAGYVQESWAA